MGTIEIACRFCSASFILLSSHVQFALIILDCSRLQPPCRHSYHMTSGELVRHARGFVQTNSVSSTRQIERLTDQGYLIRADFRERDATKHFSVKKGVFSEKGGGNSVNQGFGKDFYRKGNSVKRFGPFTEPPDSEN